MIEQVMFNQKTYVVSKISSPFVFMYMVVVGHYSLFVFQPIRPKPTVMNQGQSWCWGWHWAVWLSQSSTLTRCRHHMLLPVLLAPWLHTSSAWWAQDSLSQPLSFSLGRCLIRLVLMTTSGALLILTNSCILKEWVCEWIRSPGLMFAGL